MWLYGGMLTATQEWTRPDIRTHIHTYTLHNIMFFFWIYHKRYLKNTTCDVFVCWWVYCDCMILRGLCVVWRWDATHLNGSFSHLNSSSSSLSKYIYIVCVWVCFNECFVCLCTRWNTSYLSAIFTRQHIVRLLDKWTSTERISSCFSWK